jgi:hypothetical protein
MCASISLLGSVHKSIRGIRVSARAISDTGQIFAHNLAGVAGKAVYFSSAEVLPSR